MKSVVTALMAAAFVAPITQADTVELTISGSSATSDGRFIPGTGTLETFDTDWSIVIVYEDTNEVGFYDTVVRDAYMVIDGVRRSFDASFDPDPQRDNRQTLSGYPSPEFGMQALLFFDLGLSEGTSAWIHAEVYSGQFFPDGYQGDISQMPVGFSLADFAMMHVETNLGGAIAGSDSDLLSLGGEWLLYADSFSARVVPAPAAFSALTLFGAMSARRRR